MQSSPLTPRLSRLGTPSDESVSSAAPAGSVAPPVSMITPFIFGMMNPGVERPWSASSAAMTPNAPPTITVRMSSKRAPTTESATQAAAAASAVKPTA